MSAQSHRLAWVRVHWLGLAWLAVAVSPFIRANDQTTNKPFFLPKSPAAAAYVLGRLTDPELIAAPRGEFVYVALLQRKGLPREYRTEALAGLAKIRNTDPLTELLAGLTELDKKGDASVTVLRELLPILLQSAPDGLAANRPALEKLAKESRQPLTRQMAFAALLTADASVGRVWEETQTNPAQRVDVVLAAPLVRDAGLRAAMYPLIEPLLHQGAPADLRRATMTAIVSIPGHDQASFATLAALATAGTERDTAVASLQRIARSAWVKDQVPPLVDSLVSYLTGVPVDQRTQPEFLGAFQLATDLASLLPPERAAAVGKTLRALGVTVLVVRTIPEQMLYDKSLIVVEAAKPVEILLINDDAMPHNLVITTPGAVAEIGPLAERMPPLPDPRGRFYVPDSPKVLYATRLVESGQQAKLSFTAPSVPGDYQYVCTFPGHWLRMVGTLTVTRDVEAYLAAHPTPAPQMTEWKLADLEPDLVKVGAGRNLARGRDLYTKLACASCHKLGAEGVNYGPDLTAVLARFQNDRAEVLRQILEPSLVISNRYRNYEFELINDEPVSGMIISEDTDALTVHTGPSDALVKSLKKSDVKGRQPKASSLMPLGLLNSISKEDILDLLAWLESGGTPPAHDHPR